MLGTVNLEVQPKLQPLIFKSLRLTSWSLLQEHPLAKVDQGCLTAISILWHGKSNHSIQRNLALFHGCVASRAYNHDAPSAS